MDIKLISALAFGKFVKLLVNFKGSGATAAPGLYANKIDPLLISKLTSQFTYGNIVITGTNGKTTTSRLIAHILSSRYKIIHNRQGSNLLRGIASTLISKVTIFGKIKSDIAIWETDEAVFEQLVKLTQPKIIILLNLFRDQLDRYGEVNNIRENWKKALTALPKSTILIINADDPGLAILKKYFKGKIIYFGIEDNLVDLPKLEDNSDVKHCLNCNSALNFSSVFTSHIGKYKCSKCNFTRPKPNVSAKNLIFKKDFSTSAEFSNNNKSINYNLPGLYNVYNILASIAISRQLNISDEIITNKIQSFSSAFGRFQQLNISNIKTYIFLIKNPVGTNEVLRIISKQNDLNLLVLLNDKLADGKDVSWIWDANWELIQKNIKNVLIAGTRKWDMATRLKYADIKVSKKNVYKDINYSIQNISNILNNKDTLIILTTYTALISLQELISKQEKGSVKWQNQ